jgi:hypothetical protein
MRSLARPAKEPSEAAKGARVRAARGKEKKPATAGSRQQAARACLREGDIVLSAGAGSGNASASSKARQHREEKERGSQHCQCFTACPPRGIPEEVSFR